MQNQGYLGIYLSRDKATVVCLDSAQPSAKLIDCLEISAQDQDESADSFVELADKIAQFCGKQEVDFAHIGVAMDCSLYMQHDVHSNFTDAKQIQSTIHFDAEEALASDVGEFALAYNVLSSDETGSNLRVFTAKKKILSELIKALAANNLDPVTVEPDVTCMGRFINQRYFGGQKPQKGVLFAALNETTGYFIGPFDAEGKPALLQRTFFIAEGQDRGKLLLQQASLSIAKLGAENNLDKLLFVDSQGKLQGDEVGSALSLKTESADFAQPQQCGDAMGFAAACGAALSHIEKQPSLSFRKSFMPYLGRQRRIEQTLKVVSICCCVIFVALGLNLTIKLVQKNEPIRQMHTKFKADYAAAMPETKMPSSLTIARDRLRRERNRIKNVKSGQLSATGEKSISAKLTAVLEAFNNVASRTDLNVEKVSITTKNISITGDTSNRSNTLRLLKEIKEIMNVEQERLGTKSGRDTFSITVAPKS